MALVYFDASAFVKLLVSEDGSDLAGALWDGADAILSSRIAFPEVCAALGAAERDHRIAPSARRRAVQTWQELWREVRAVEVTDEVTHAAGTLAIRHGLRGADAIHLASALAPDRHDTVVAVWDRRLHAGVAQAGLAVAPAALP